MDSKNEPVEWERLTRPEREGIVDGWDSRGVVHRKLIAYCMSIVPELKKKKEGEWKKT